MQYRIEVAENQLAKLVDAALAGEDVIIAKGAKPAARLVAIPQSGFKLGILDGKLGTPPDFLEPMPAKDLADWEGRDGSVA